MCVHWQRAACRCKRHVERPPKSRPAAREARQRAGYFAGSNIFSSALPSSGTVSFSS
ncbi:MAG: hypothetical protein AW07_03218 [Candidatus Accumulibacter sp. SK-11]|nr:MAG: hypothetical protein AW07_03218 [Candidatus Accumulibacter sp. SK-11]